MQISRPTPERFDDALALLRDADIAVYGDSDWTRDELEEEWENLDLERDAWLVEVDGRLAGVAHLLDRRGGRFIGDAYVHPELTGRGVGNRVLALVEERVHELRSSWPDGERIVLECAHLVGDGRAPHLFRSRGFEYVRSGLRSVVAPGVDADNPTGAVRLYEHAAMHVLWRADVWQKELRGYG